MERLGVAADEVDGVEAGELPPGKPAVSPARTQFLAEHGDRPLPGFVDVREGAACRLCLRDGAQLDVQPAQLRPRTTAEVVCAERGEEEARPGEPGQLRRR